MQCEGPLLYPSGPMSSSAFAEQHSSSCVSDLGGLVRRPPSQPTNQPSKRASKQANERTNGQTSERASKQPKQRMNKRTGVQTNKHTKRCTYAGEYLYTYASMYKYDVQYMCCSLIVQSRFLIVLAQESWVWGKSYLNHIQLYELIWKS